ncbi:helix-turn-helix transcriptional regulator [Allokutzneria sp. A3M-2-11 16]|uniref:winged helix-turn-helix transcriptional regulator n=1 Tax=Allokutzneria sp. A3M-2-11 16 TaxID=2962043 RepID=UPI0020B7565F|nr:helix-turn-helix domain-containing protein [Allokutzneria sp. A3M-2-11 16]MCP3805490.1 helix-turn-helix transcriptional regulator [Allokutzneria sp. A3M-2-11 16]
MPTAYDAFHSACPARELHDRISDRWVSLIMNALAEGDHRYSDLSRVVLGITQKMLTQTLRRLERDGLVSRTVIPQRPVRVDYSLTPLGRSLLPVMRAIKLWAEAHIEDVHAARADYDTLTSGAGSGAAG